MMTDLIAYLPELVEALRWLLCVHWGIPPWLVILGFVSFCVMVFGMLAVLVVPQRHG